MCKDTTKKSNDQTELFISDAFRVEKPVKVSFTAPEQSNLGGLSLIAKSDKESGLCEKFASLIPEWRNETLLVHSLPQLARQRVYQIAAGFEDADDCDDLRHDSILKMCVGRTPNNVPLASQPTMTRLAMFCSHEVITWAAQQNKVRFITGLSGNQKLNQLASNLISEVKAEYAKTKKDVRRYQEFQYKASSWTHEERVIVKVEHNVQGLNVRYIVTNFKDCNPRRLYEKKYCKRGDCELYIKEMKNGVYADRMSCHKFSANQFRLYLSALAYILLQDVRHKMLRKSSLKASTLITLRNKIIFSPVKVTEQKTQIRVEFQPKHPKRGWIHWNLKVAQDRLMKGDFLEW